MKLVDILESIETIDEELIIFQEDKNDYSSDVILAYGGIDDNGLKNENGKTYHYLLEALLAKEFIEEWTQSLSYVPTPDDIAIRLHYYAQNDA